MGKPKSCFHVLIDLRFEAKVPCFFLFFFFIHMMVDVSSWMLAGLGVHYSER